MDLDQSKKKIIEITELLEKYSNNEIDIDESDLLEMEEYTNNLSDYFKAIGDC